MFTKICTDSDTLLCYLVGKASSHAYIYTVDNIKLYIQYLQSWRYICILYCISIVQNVTKNKYTLQLIGTARAASKLGNKIYVVQMYNIMHGFKNKCSFQLYIENSRKLHLSYTKCNTHWKLSDISGNVYFNFNYFTSACRYQIVMQKSWIRFFTGWTLLQ